MEQFGQHTAAFLAYRRRCQEAGDPLWTIAPLLISSVTPMAAWLAVLIMAAIVFTGNMAGQVGWLWEHPDTL